MRMSYQHAKMLMHHVLKSSGAARARQGYDGSPSSDPGIRRDEPLSSRLEPPVPSRCPGIRKSTVRRPALPARAILGLVGIVPGPVAPPAVVAPGDVRLRQSMGSVDRAWRDVAVGRNAKAQPEDDARSEVPVVAPLRVTSP